VAQPAGRLCGKGSLMHLPAGAGCRAGYAACDSRENFPQQDSLRGACNGKGFSGTMRFSKTKGEPNEQDRTD
jgi:hypothetical protein